MRIGTIVIACLFAVAAGTPAAAQICQPGSSGPGGMAPCSPCSPGFFSSVPGSAFCVPCAPGTFAGGAGSVACTQCPDGSITPAPGSIVCQVCPAGYTSDLTHTTCVPLATPAPPMSWGRLKIIYR